MKMRFPVVCAALPAALFVLLVATASAPCYPVYFKNGSVLEVTGHRVEAEKVYLELTSGEAEFKTDELDMERTTRELGEYEARLASAQEMFDTGDYDGAAAVYEGMLGKGSQDVRLLYMYGRALTAARRYEGAIRQFRRVQEIDPSWPKVRTRLGDIYYGQGKYYEAIDQFLLALDEDPDDKEAHLGLGMCYARQEMFEGARTELYRAIELQPGYPMAYAMLGYVYYKKSRFEDARTALEMAIKLDDKLPEAHYYMGLLYGVLGLEASDSTKRLDYFDQSIESFRKAVTLRNHFPEAHADLGVAFYNRGSVARAVEEFNIALSQRPDMAVTHNNLAGIYIRSGFYEEAVSEARKAVDIDPHMVESYFIMGNAYSNMRNYPEAAKAYDRYLYYSPEGELSEEVRQRLERVIREGGLEDIAPEDADGA